MEGGFKLNKTFLMGFAGPRGIALAFIAQFVIQGWIAGPLAAQLNGVVTRPGGLPVEGVSVEAWSADRRVGATLTNGLGCSPFPRKSQPRRSCSA